MNMKNIKGYTEHLKESSVTPEELGKRLVLFVSNVNLERRPGADVNTFTGTKPQMEYLRRLIDGGADLNAKDDQDGWTALHWVAFLGSVEAVRALLDAGAEIDAMDGNGYTPLFVATLMRRGRDAAKELILRGANLGAFADLEALEEAFDGDISWLPQELLPEEWRKARRSRSAFGRF
jgi:hypothetical protein